MSMVLESGRNMVRGYEMDYFLPYPQLSDTGLSRRFDEMK